MNTLKILSIVSIVLGILLFLVGYVFRIMHLSDLYAGIYSGPVMFSIGIILFVIQKIKDKRRPGDKPSA